MALLHDEASGLWYRDKHDLSVIRESERLYSALPILPGSTVLDLGGYIGSAARIFCTLGAGAVVSVEADADNFAVLQVNAAGFPIAAANRAVTSDGKPITLALNPDNRSSHYVVVTGRTKKAKRVVEGITLGALLEAWRPAFIKCDIEYSEYRLPELLALPEHVRGLQMEVPLSQRAHPGQGLRASARH
jgi:FkbM family methyltransferase